MTVLHMRIACWIPKATDTHSGCVIYIDFPLQQWLHERVSLLRYTYIACLVYFPVLATQLKHGGTFNNQCISKR
jgi:hypothetical protein